MQILRDFFAGQNVYSAIMKEPEGTTWSMQPLENI